MLKIAFQNMKNDFSHELAVGPAGVTPEKLQERFNEIFKEIMKTPHKWYVTVESSFEFNERAVGILNSMYHSVTAIIERKLDYSEKIGLVCSIPDREGYLQQILERNSK